MECLTCSSKIEDNILFCVNCGSLTKLEELSNSGSAKLYEAKFIELVQNVKNYKSSEVLWNETINNQVRKYEKIKYIFENEEVVKNSNRFLEQMNSLIDRCKTPEFHIAFVGTIKAGKSTLINALLGRNLASTSVTPETATLTKFRCSPMKNYVKVKYYNAVEWDQLWASISKNADVFLQEYNLLKGDEKKAEWIGKEEYFRYVTDNELETEIEKWTSSKHVEHYFVKEVEVGLTDFKMPEQVVFVDTPGLDDAVQYRSDITRGYIDRANAVFACVKADSLTGPELSTLYRVFSNTSYNPEKVHVIGTQWDSINSPFEDWKLQKNEWVKYLSQKSCFGSVDIAERNITHSAAYLNNLSRDFPDISDKELKTLYSTAMKFDVMPQNIEEKLPELVEISNIHTIERKIKTEIVSKYSDLLIEDLNQSFSHFKSELSQLMGEVKNNHLEILETSSKSVQEIRNEYEKSKLELETINQYKKQLEASIEVVKEDTDRRISNLTETLRALVK